MGFIEKMVTAMSGTAVEEPTLRETAALDERGGEPQAESIPKVELESQTQQPALPATQEALEQFLTDKKTEWMEEQRTAEQARLDTLPEAERLKREGLSKDDEISRLKAELARHDLQSAVVTKLAERRLPASVADLVQYGDEASTMQSLDKISSVVESMVTEAIELRMRGKAPEGLHTFRKPEHQDTDAFIQAFAKVSQR